MRSLFFLLMLLKIQHRFPSTGCLSQFCIHTLKSGTLNLDITSHRKLINSNARPSLCRHNCSAQVSDMLRRIMDTHRFRWLSEELIISLIHGRKVLHVGEVDVDLHHIL